MPSNHNAELNPEYRFMLYVPSDQEDELEEIDQYTTPLLKWADDVKKEMEKRHLPTDGVVIFENEEVKPEVPKKDTSSGITLSRNDVQTILSAWNTFLEKMQHVDTFINRLTKM
ncbi:hypothetical protein Ddc_09639 [Ditylenchus destructor]|nr:hypothetical protein Ddc_09639 [Ditylenchus destructor]